MPPFSLFLRSSLQYPHAVCNRTPEYPLIFLFSSLVYASLASTASPASAFEGHADATIRGTPDIGPKSDSDLSHLSCIQSTAKWRWCICIYSAAAVSSQLIGNPVDSRVSFFHGCFSDLLILGGEAV